MATRCFEDSIDLQCIVSAMPQGTARTLLASVAGLLEQAVIEIDKAVVALSS